jgi:hypothetical protein
MMWAVPHWQTLELFGRGEANLTLFFRLLFADRTETGAVFTWFSEPQLWQLKRLLLWQPMKTGHLRIAGRDIDEMSLARVIETFQWVCDTRRAEAEVFRKANEDAAKKARGK